MARKDSQGRLTIPIDIWDLVDFENCKENKFVFFVTKTSEVVIASLYADGFENLECLGYCRLDEKHRFFIPKNVDLYLGNELGDEKDYYFSTYISKKCVYLHKIEKFMPQNISTTLDFISTC
ncbi:MAG: hypothetical protein GX682_01820 [Clostridiaceae bacterium]|nr:hypothetical protein [Clostridiaceae bacterium]